MLCKLKNNGETLNIMLPENNSWLVSHTIKHPIKGYKEEGWNLYIDEDISEINENSSKVSEISDLYISLLKSFIEDDINSPRNASYSFSDKSKKNKFILVLNKDGFSVIMKKIGKKYVLLTGYGINDMDTKYLGDGYFKFKKLFDDSTYRKNAAIAEWNGKFEDDSSKYTNIKKELSENWEISL